VGRPSVLRLPPRQDLLRGEGGRRRSSGCRRALREYDIWGVRTTIPSAARIMDHPDFVAGQIHTGFIEENIAGLTEYEIAEREIYKLARFRRRVSGLGRNSTAAESPGVGMLGKPPRKKGTGRSSSRSGTERRSAHRHGPARDTGQSDFKNRFTLHDLSRLMPIYDASDILRRGPGGARLHSEPDDNMSTPSRRQSLLGTGCRTFLTQTLIRATNVWGTGCTRATSCAFAVESFPQRSTCGVVSTS